MYLKKKEKRAIYMGWFISISDVYQDLHLITVFTALEAVVRRCSVRKMFLEILQNSQENTCARVFLNKVVGLRNFAKFKGNHLCQSLFLNKVAACNFIKKETLTQVFSFEFREISKNTFHYRTPLVVASAALTLHVLLRFLLHLFSVETNLIKQVELS